jgi:hypothetical protein
MDLLHLHDPCLPTPPILCVRAMQASRIRSMEAGTLKREHISRIRHKESTHTHTHTPERWVGLGSCSHCHQGLARGTLSSRCRASSLGLDNLCMVRRRGCVEDKAGARRGSLLCPFPMPLDNRRMRDERHPRFNSFDTSQGNAKQKRAQAHAWQRRFRSPVRAVCACGNAFVVVLSRIVIFKNSYG